MYVYFFKCIYTHCIKPKHIVLYCITSNIMINYHILYIYAETM